LKEANVGHGAAIANQRIGTVDVGDLLGSGHDARDQSQGCQEESQGTASFPQPSRPQGSYQEQQAPGSNHDGQILWALVKKKAWPPSMTIDQPGFLHGVKKEILNCQIHPHPL
jgi:hypothetical protein